MVDYDTNWPRIFEELREKVWPAVKGVAKTIEHVGSTAVPGLAAKPVIDMSVVVPSVAEVQPAIEGLAKLRYVHLGDLGIEGREAFGSPDGLPDHHLYVCPEGSLPLVNHLAVRDYLRTHPEVAQTYGELKKRLAAEFSNDIEGYIDGKTDLLIGVLKEAGLQEDHLKAIEIGNRK